MAEQEIVLGPGAKGDPYNPQAQTDLSEASADEVVQAVETGEVSAQDALAAEESRKGGPRKTVKQKIGDES